MGYLAWRVTLPLLALVAMTTTGVRGGPKPNIIIMMADDVGWADYEVHDPQMATPSLTALAQRGLVLNQSYTLQTCTPTRSALLSGRYSYKIGMQAGKIKGTYLRWLNESVKLLPASLQELGYKTHAVGKWHLGFCNWNLTPRYRGFDTFYGFLSGEQGYFTHSGSDGESFDFRDNGRIAWENKGHYSTELHTERVQEIIKNRNRAPFFIYMAYQNAHSPWEAKQSYIDKYCSHVKDKKRRIHCAMVAAMDESIGNITQTLDEEGIANDTILLYLSDNGGPTKYGSSNWPLRGGKASFWEGGTRSHTIFVYPRGLTKVNATWDSLVHVTDWYTTFLSAAKGNVTKAKVELDLDGHDHMTSLKRFAPGQRTQMVYNIDDRRNRAAVRIGDFKLLRDPEERHNLIDDPQYAELVAELESFMTEESKKLVPFPAELIKDKMGDPKYYGGVWSPGWCCL
ncbi:arylsulfatase B-like [Babylonia areolata]|uniref:arylsulfatase B-like n=1 Tax=Babylonia areolata TaxID=304850 RepID=UPI003FD35124